MFDPSNSNVSYPVATIIALTVAAAIAFAALYHAVGHSQVFS